MNIKKTTILWKKNIQYYLYYDERIHEHQENNYSVKEEHIIQFIL